MASIVLVPGAWLGAWAWQRVAGPLRAAGHDVHAVTLTGLGDRAHLGDGGTGLADHVRDVLAVIETEDLDDVVLVGHSYAGAVVGDVAAAAPERVSRVVYLGGVVLGAGRSLFDVAPPGMREAVEERVAAGDGHRVPLVSDEELSMFFGDHGISDADLLWLRSRAVGHPVATHREPAAAGAEGSPAARTYVHLSEDPPAPVEAGPGWEVVELEAGHWPMISAPDPLARMLDRIARAA